jgi:hypothetical protein
MQQTCVEMAKVVGANELKWTKINVKTSIFLQLL